jgi:hypothetical protein
MTNQTEADAANGRALRCPVSSGRRTVTRPMLHDLPGTDLITSDAQPIAGIPAVRRLGRAAERSPAGTSAKPAKTDTPGMRSAPCSIWAGAQPTAASLAEAAFSDSVSRARRGRRRGPTALARACHCPLKSCAPYAPHRSRPGRVSAGDSNARKCTPEPCAQVRILLGAPKSNTQANRILLVLCHLTWANVPA